MTDETILWFDAISKDDGARAGGKGANLGELVRAGIPVPPGFVVSAGSYAAFLERGGLHQPIAEQLAGADAGNVAALQVVSGEIKALIEAAAVPEELAGAVREAYARLGGGFVAVRSSATAEDLAEASFAGQQSTYLNVAGAEHVVEALRACWASLFEPQAIAYRAQRGFDHLTVHIAVVVQTMVEADRSGVLFTVNPVTGDRGQLVLEAVYGLGEAAVSGMVTPDTYIVDKATLAVLERAHAEQEQELVRDAAATGLHANVWRDVPPERRDRPKLTDDEIAALAELALRVEAHYGRPQDIEWALADGRFSLLQARPVTTI